MIITVSWGGGFDLKGSFAVVSVVDIPIICACQVTDPWRHKSDLWRHRCDTASFMSTIRAHGIPEMHQNTTSYAELKILEFPKIWLLTSHNWVKYWPKTKNNTTNREYSARAICWSFPLRSTTLCLETPRGVAPPPSPVRSKVAKHRIRARVNVLFHHD